MITNIYGITGSGKTRLLNKFIPMDNTNIFDDYRGNIDHLRGNSIDHIVATETMLEGCDRYIHLHF